MNAENWAKIREIIRKTGEKLVVLDPQGGEPLILMGLNAYEKLVFPGSSDKLDTKLSFPGTHLTPPPAPGIIDPVSALQQERQSNVPQDWGEDDEDRYYMEPIE